MTFMLVMLLCIRHTSNKHELCTSPNVSLTMDSLKKQFSQKTKWSLLVQFNRRVTSHYMYREIVSTLIIIHSVLVIILTLISRSISLFPSLSYSLSLSPYCSPPLQEYSPEQTLATIYRCPPCRHGNHALFIWITQSFLHKVLFRGYFVRIQTQVLGPLSQPLVCWESHHWNQPWHLVSSLSFCCCRSRLKEVVVVVVTVQLAWPSGQSLRWLITQYSRKLHSIQVQLQLFACLSLISPFNCLLVSSSCGIC